MTSTKFCPRVEVAEVHEHVVGAEVRLKRIVETPRMTGGILASVADEDLHWTDLRCHEHRRRLGKQRRIVHDSLPDTTEHQPRTPSRVHDSLPDTKP